MAGLHRNCGCIQPRSGRRGSGGDLWLPPNGLPGGVAKGDHVATGFIQKPTWKNYKFRPGDGGPAILMVGGRGSVWECRREACSFVQRQRPHSELGTPHGVTTISAGGTVDTGIGATIKTTSSVPTYPRSHPWRPEPNQRHTVTNIWKCARMALSHVRRLTKPV